VQGVAVARDGSQSPPIPSPRAEEISPRLNASKLPEKLEEIVADKVVAELIATMISEAEDPNSALINELRRFKVIPKEEWAMPAGFTTRMAPKYLSHIYRGRRTAVDYMKEWIRAHGIESSPCGKELLRLAEMLDSMLLRDKVLGMVNLVSVEKTCRRMRGLEIAFSRCRTEGDWRRGKGQAANWAPKTDWRGCDLVDVSSLDPSAFRLEEMEEEIQKERERTATILKAQGKLETLGPKVDPRDS